MILLRFLTNLELTGVKRETTQKIWTQQNQSENPQFEVVVERIFKKIVVRELSCLIDARHENGALEIERPHIFASHFFVFAREVWSDFKSKIHFESSQNS